VKYCQDPDFREAPGYSLFRKPDLIRIRSGFRVLLVIPGSIVGDYGKPGICYGFLGIMPGFTAQIQVLAGHLLAGDLPGKECGMLPGVCAGQNMN